jgi:hypothetical protein
MHFEVTWLKGTSTDACRLRIASEVLEVLDNGESTEKAARRPGVTSTIFGPQERRT